MNPDSNGKDSVTWRHPRVITMFLFGISAGLPLLLIFSTLSVWLREAGVSRSAVTFFSWAALGYSFKFFWAPLVDRLPLPVLTRRLGRRRAWLLLAQALICAAIVAMALVDPAAGQGAITRMALAAVMLGFSSATQDIVIDAFRIECAPSAMQAMLSASYIAGYRVGMLCAGAGGLYLAGLLGSAPGAYDFSAWRITYLAMALCMAGCMGVTLCVAEPGGQGTGGRGQGRGDRGQGPEFGGMAHARFLLLFILAAAAFAGTFFFTGQAAAGGRAALTPLAGKALAALLAEALRLALAVAAALGAAWAATAAGLAERDMVRQTWILPVTDFFARYGRGTAWLLLALVGCYRVSDIVLGVISNVFYIDMGYSKAVIATVTKTFGLFMTIAGGFVGGVLAGRLGVMRTLFLGALLSAGTNLLFMLLARAGENVPLLTLVIAADNLSAGLASAAFVAFLSSLTSISFTAVQYAIFSSLMTLLPKVLGGYSGSLAEAWGYPGFFLFTALMGLPVLVLVRRAGVLLADRSPNRAATDGPGT